jgi:hypothetical protein
MRSKDLRNLALNGCVMALLVGCNQSRPISTVTPANPPSPQPSAGVSLSRPSVIVGTNGWGPTVIYNATDSKQAPYASLAGCLPAVDGQGNVYMLAFHPPYGCGYYPSSIDVYPSNAVGGASRIRSLPVGPGMKIPNVKDMAVTTKGEIFVNDGNGVAVFSITANGTDAPVREIQWDGGGDTPVTPGFIAVDGKDNLYVQNGLSIAVFGPDDTGLVVPSKVISGPHTQLAGLGRMTTDVQGNLYVTLTLNPHGVLEFAAGVNGDAVPLRFVSSSKMSNFDGILGVAVDSSGLIYVRANDPYCGGVFVFAADASGTTDPLSVLSGEPCYDIDGTIAVY